MNLSNLNLPRYLSNLPLFSDMNEVELAQIAQDGCMLRQFQRGDIIFRTGEPCEEFHVVVTGQAKLFALSPTGSEKVIELLGPGHSFGEAMMFTGRRYIVSSQALSETVLLTVKRQAVIGAIEHDPRFALRMMAGMARRLHGLIRDVEAYSLHSGVQRVIGYLVGDATSKSDLTELGMTVSLPVSKAAIASRLSLTPEYFSRVLGELENAGLIQVDKRDIHILDSAKLAAYQPK